MDCEDLFRSPKFTTLDELEKLMVNFPEQFRPTFSQISHDSGSIICNGQHLHVWETQSDVDDLMHIIHLAVSMSRLAVYVPRPNALGISIPDCSVVIVAEDSDSKRDNFKRVCDVLKHCLKETGEVYCEGHILVFTSLIVVRGFDFAHNPCKEEGLYSEAGIKEALAAVARISEGISLVRKGLKKEKIVWHNGHVLHFLNFFIRRTTAEIRGSLAAITMTNVLTMGPNRIWSTEFGRRRNCVKDFQNLMDHLELLDLTVTFLDPLAQRLHWPHLGAYVLNWGLYYQALLPESVYKKHLQYGFDWLVTYSYRLLAAAEDKTPAETVALVKRHLGIGAGNDRLVRQFTNICLIEGAYEKVNWARTSRKENMELAYFVANAPLLPFKGDNWRMGVPAVARMSVGASEWDSTYTHLSIPVSIDFESFEFRIQAPSAFRLWVTNTPLKPKPVQQPKPEDARAAAIQELASKENVRIQGVFRECIEHVLDKSKNHVVARTPEKEAQMREQWAIVKKACIWALDTAAWKATAEMGEQIATVKKNLENGWFEYGLKRLEGMEKQQQG